MCPSRDCPRNLATVVLVQGNSLRGQGLKAISTALRANTKLQMLDLNDNDVGPDVEALRAFAELLKANKTLTHINFEHNRIEEVGAGVLIDSGALEVRNTRVFFLF